MSDLTDLAAVRAAEAVLEKFGTAGAAACFAAALAAAEEGQLWSCGVEVRPAPDGEAVAAAAAALAGLRGLFEGVSPSPAAQAEQQDGFAEFARVEWENLKNRLWGTDFERET